MSFVLCKAFPNLADLLGHPSIETRNCGNSEVINITMNLIP